MKVANRDLLTDFIAKHADAGGATRTWFTMVEAAQWRTPQELTRTFPKASNVGGGIRWVFDIRGNRYRLDVKIDYKRQICRIMRIGTHAEYDSWKFDN